MHLQSTKGPAKCEGGCQQHCCRNARVYLQRPNAVTVLYPQMAVNSACGNIPMHLHLQRPTNPLLPCRIRKCGTADYCLLHRTITATTTALHNYKL